jgi:hypothetical protein
VIVWVAAFLACNFTFALGLCIGIARERRQRKTEIEVMRSRSPFYRSKM